LVTIGSGVSEGAGVEFPTFPLTCVVVLKTLWHYRASVWYGNYFKAEIQVLPANGTTSFKDLFSFWAVMLID